MPNDPTTAPPEAAPAAPATEPVTAPPADDHVPGEDALGDPGKRALDAMKAARNAAREEAAQFRAQLDAMQAKIAGTEAEHAARIEREKVQAEAMAKANERILKAEVCAAAAGKLNDPADALRYLNLSELEVSEDGATDSAAIAARIEDLIKQKPYLAAPTAPRFDSSADGGVRTGATPAQLTSEAVQKMYAAKDYAGIEKARTRDA